MKGLLPECWRHIFSFLGPCALLNCANVSQRWCSLARDERVWARHARRVREQLGEFCQEVEHQAWPTWQRFVTHLLRAEAGLSRFGTFASFTIPSLFASIPADWRIDLIYSQQVDTYSSHIVAYKEKVRHGSFIEIAPDVIMLSGQLRTGEFFEVDGTVKPRQLRRFHRIVRDDDYQGPVEHRFWFRIL
jgi:hypothetical protein